MPFDPGKVLAVLSDHQVRFVLVGMGAGYVQGAPYPSYNTDICPRSDGANLARLDKALETLRAEPLKHNEWGPAPEPVHPGYRQLHTDAGMVNIVDCLPGVGDYQKVIGEADRLEVADGLFVWVVSLRAVIRSKETLIKQLGDRNKPYRRMMDGVHVLMCHETVQLREQLTWACST